MELRNMNEGLIYLLSEEPLDLLWCCACVGCGMRHRVGGKDKVLKDSVLEGKVEHQMHSLVGDMG